MRFSEIDCDSHYQSIYIYKKCNEWLFLKISVTLCKIKYLHDFHNPLMFTKLHDSSPLLWNLECSEFVYNSSWSFYTIDSQLILPTLSRRLQKIIDLMILIIVGLLSFKSDSNYFNVSSRTQKTNIVIGELNIYIYIYIPLQPSSSYTNQNFFDLLLKVWCASLLPSSKHNFGIFLNCSPFYGAYLQVRLIMAGRGKDLAALLPKKIPVDKLVLGKTMQHVVVRVLRMWEARNFKLNGTLMSLDLLLLDEKVKYFLLCLNNLYHISSNILELLYNAQLTPFFLKICQGNSYSRVNIPSSSWYI